MGRGEAGARARAEAAFELVDDPVLWPQVTGAREAEAVGGATGGGDEGIAPPRPAGPVVAEGVAHEPLFLIQVVNGHIQSAIKIRRGMSP